MLYNPLARRSIIFCRAIHSSSVRRVPLVIDVAQFRKLPKSTTVPVDVSWHMPNSHRSAMAEFLSGPRLPGAKRLDLDEVAELRPDKNPLSLTHMLPSGERFREEAEKLGITEETHVVVYDSVGVFSSPRGAFTFKAFGHNKVSVLDGGLPRWIAEGGEVEVGEKAENHESQYPPLKGPNEILVRTYDQVVHNSLLPPKAADLVLDARALPRFTGEAPEPRAGLSSGHIPNSQPLPFTELLEPASADRPYTSYKSPEALRKALVAAVGGEEEWKELQEGDRALVFSCGSGMTAAVGWLATQIVANHEGKDKFNAAIYDESWTGYASRKESKIIKGPQETKGV